MIIKKTIFGAAVAALMAPNILVTSVHADGPQSITSKATISFSGMPDDTIKTVDPTNPEVPVDPNNPTNPDQPGNPEKPDNSGLFLITVPRFNFGSYSLKDGKNMSLKPILNKNNFYQMYSAQVSDVRTGGKGWTLSVSNTQFMNTKNNNKLTGATITLNAPSVYNSGQVNPKEEVTKNPAYQGSGVVLDGTSSSTVMDVKAGQNAGNLVTSINWSKDDITLAAPVANVSPDDDFESYLTWTLAAAQ